MKKLYSFVRFANLAFFSGKINCIKNIVKLAELAWALQEGKAAVLPLKARSKKGIVPAEGDLVQLEGRGR